MHAMDILSILREQREGVFTTHEIAQLTGSGAKYASLITLRMLKGNMIRRAERGKYYLPNTSIYAIASNMVYPSYVSLFAAFRYYNLTTQMPRIIDIVTTKRHKEIEELEGSRIRFVTFQKRRFFGFGIDRETGALVADIEKALVDSLYMSDPQYAYVEEAATLAHANDVLSSEKLMFYAERMESKKTVTLARELVSMLAKAKGASDERRKQH